MFHKMRNFIQNSKTKKIFAMCLSLCTFLCIMIPFANAVDGVATTEMSPAEAAGETFSIISQQLNFTTILSVLGVVVAAALGMVLCWWGARKIKNVLMSAFRSGKLKV